MLKQGFVFCSCLEFVKFDVISGIKNSEKRNCLLVTKRGGTGRGENQHPLKTVKSQEMSLKEFDLVELQACVCATCRVVMGS